MLRFFFDIIVGLLKLLLNVVFLLPLLAYKIVVNHKACILLCSSRRGEKAEGGNKEPKKRTGRKLSERNREMLAEIDAEIQHQKLHGAPRYPSPPERPSLLRKIIAIAIIILILVAFIFVGYHI